MHFFGLLFWLAILWFAFRALRRRGYCSFAAPRGYGRFGGGWYDSGEFYSAKHRAMVPKPAPRSEAQQEYIDSLESRVTELEERLDFTERLLANRGEKETQA